MSSPSRRAFLLGASAAALSSVASAHNNAGLVTPPEAPPTVSLTLDDDKATTLQALLKNRVTALQLMFTVCQATCPLQGALFGETIKKLAERVKPAQLLSISIDPDRDTPAALREWLKRFGASPRWRGARPDKAQLEALVGFLKSKNPGPDPHTAQVYYFNREGKLVLRSTDFPPADDIIQTLDRIATKA